MVISPARHSTSRITRGWLCGLACCRTECSSTGMKSVTTTTPVPVEKTVSRRLVRSRYRWWTRCGSSGWICQLPPFSASRIRANSACPSKRGRHSQSMLPSTPTSAAERQSPIRPYEPIGRYPSIRSDELARPFGSVRLVLVLGARVIVLLDVCTGRRLLGVRLEGAHAELSEIVLGIVAPGGAASGHDLIVVLVERGRVNPAGRQERILGVGAELLAPAPLGQRERRLPGVLGCLVGLAKDDLDPLVLEAGHRGRIPIAGLHERDEAAGDLGVDLTERHAAGGLSPERRAFAIELHDVAGGNRDGRRLRRRTQHRDGALAGLLGEELHIDRCLRAGCGALALEHHGELANIFLRDEVERIQLE